MNLDQAQVDDARLNLDYCRIASPVDGRVGLRLVDEGNYVRTSDTSGIVVVTQMKPITVVFTIPEDRLQQVLARLQRSSALPVEAFDRSGNTLIATGKLATVDNQIDSTTGTIKLKALFANDDERLFPNQFVNVRLLLDTLSGITTVPAGAVLRGSVGAYVYLVNDDGTVSVRPVSVGVSNGDRTQVTKGLAVGERVVTDGVDRLRDGIRVTLPAASAAAAAPSGVPPANPRGAQATP